MKLSVGYIHKVVGIFLLILVILYYSRGIIIPEEGPIGAIILLVILAISFVYLLKLIPSYKQWHISLNLWLFLILLTTTYFLISGDLDRKSTRLNSSHVRISYAVFCLKKK